MKYFFVFILFLASCTERETTAPAPTTRSVAQPDTSSVPALSVDTAWADTTTATF